MFNHFTNKSDVKIFTTDATTDFLYFDINFNINFSFIYICLSDKHDNHEFFKIRDFLFFRKMEKNQCKDIITMNFF